MTRSLSALKIIVFIFCLALVVTFVIKNMGPVDLYYYNYKFQLLKASVPLLVVILTSFSLGFILAWLFGFVSKVQLSSRVRKQTKTIQDMNAEMQKLKSAKDESGR